MTADHLPGIERGCKNHTVQQREVSLSLVLLSRKAWRKATPLVRRITVVMWSAAFCITTIAIYLDHIGWWSDRPFITNLVSAVVGGLFGIPVAVIVLQELYAHQQAIVSRQLADRAREHVKSAIDRWIPGFVPDTQAARRQVRELDKWYASHLRYEAARPEDAMERKQDGSERRKIRAWWRVNGPFINDLLADVSISWSHYRELLFRQLPTAEQKRPIAEVDELLAYLKEIKIIYGAEVNDFARDYSVSRDYLLKLTDLHRVIDWVVRPDGTADGQ